MPRWRPIAAWLAALALAVLLPLALAGPASADPTPPTLGGDMLNCFLPSAAFCDDFSEGAYTGSAANRGGDLDPTRWSVARETEAVNPGQGQYQTFSPTTAQFCQTPLTGVLPDHDSFMCDGTNGTTTADQGTEDMHWMTAMNDAGNYATISARALRPFDFAGRTGTISFMVDAKTRGGHSTWAGVTLADDPIPDAHGLHPGVDSPPRDGFEINFDAGCGTPASVDPADGAALSDYPQTTVGDVRLFSDYQERDWSPQDLGTLPCVAAQDDHPNLIRVQVSQASLDVWMADAIQNMQPGMPMTPPPLKHILHLDQASGWSLATTRGYVGFDQSQYFGAKFNGTSERTYHWHALGFDGPVLPADRDYEVPDSLQPRSDGSVNLGYLLPHAPFALTGVDPAGAAAAYASFNFRGDAGATVQVRANGNAWHPATLAYAGAGATTNALAAIPPGELVAGANTLEIAATGSGPVVSNIDLVLQFNPPPGATATVTPTATPTPTASPSATATAAPTDTPTPQPSATGTPMPVPGFIAGRHYACTSYDGGQTYQCVRP